MTLPVVIRAVARDEAAETVRWYDNKRFGLGGDFFSELQQILEEIGQQPDRYPIVLDETREAPLTRFPYCVYYRSQPNRVIVTAVVHTSRDPSIWQARI